MKLTTNDRELVCLLIALNGAAPEASHVARKRKVRCYDQLDMERIGGLAQPGAERERVLPSMWPADAVELDNVESGTQDYLIEKFGADGEVCGGAFIERTVCKFIDKLRSTE
jgi:hypothetical protein